MNEQKPYVKALCVAASIFILDAVILNQGFIAVILILLALFVFFPIAVLLRRRDKRKYEQRLVKIAIYVLTGVAVLACNALQNRVADRRAILIGNACLAIAQNTINIRRSLTSWSLNSCLPFLVPNGTAKVSDIPGGRWMQIMSLCSITQRCRLLDDASITWSLERGAISIDSARSDNGQQI
jgi:O-antigen ligase